jgi:hypothetical protein
MKSLLINSFVFMLVSLIGITACTKQNNLTADETKAIAEEAYIYAFPMLDNYKMMFVQAVWPQSPAYEAPFNQIKNSAVLLGPEYTTIVRPNNDTFYSIIWLDLRAEPQVISVSAISDKRYYSWQLIDMYTHNIDYIGTRETGFGAGQYLLAGPEWNGEQPDGVEKVIQTEGNFLVALARTQVYSEDDLEDAVKVQNGYKVESLSEFIGTDPPAPAAELDYPVFSPEKVKSAEFITYLNFMLGQLKPHSSEIELLKKFAKIGIGPNLSYDVEALDPEMKKAIEDGIASAMVKIEAETQKLGVRENGWMQSSGIFGTREMMQGKYLTRAAAAMMGLWGNTLEEAFYPETSVDENNEVLDGSKHNYVLHFEKDEIPPVKGFWSLSMYKLPEQLFIENPINRYVISSATKGLKYNKDGSLDVYIQKKSPGKKKESNWLPAHDGLFSLQARLYWPNPEALDPLYVLPVVKKTK